MRDQQEHESEAPRRVGRPSIQDLRKEQIVAAFIDLVAANGLGGVSLDEVAVRAGVKRTAIRHFVGNRDELITAAVEEITNRAIEDLGESTSFTRLAARLFSPERIMNLTAAADAWIVLLPEALRLPEGRHLVKSSWDQLMESISAALRLEFPGATEVRIRDTAYSVACLAEQDFVFQLVGFPRARSKAAMNAALALASRLG